MGKKGKEAKRREKKQRTGKKHSSLKPQDYYDVSGDSVNRKRKNCPRCGPGTWLGSHKGRLYCGKCGYTEFERRPPAAPQGAQGDKQSEQPPVRERPASDARPSQQPEKTTGQPSVQEPESK